VAVEDVVDTVSVEVSAVVPLIETVAGEKLHDVPFAGVVVTEQ